MFPEDGIRSSLQNVGVYSRVTDSAQNFYRDYGRIPMSESFVVKFE
jgi:hypothetical protein